MVPEPLVTSDVDLRDFAFMPLDVLRLRDSELSATPDAEAFRCAVLSWCVSWHQVPAGSLPDDDATLARLLGFGRDLKGWKKIRAADGLRGWIKCSDGRLYHPVVAEKAADAWKAKIAQRARTEAARKAREDARQRQQQSQSHSLSQRNETSVTDDVTASKGQGQGQGQVNPSEPSSPGEPPDVTMNAVPTSPGEWLSWFNREHGLCLNPTSTHDRKGLWPLATRWCNARVSTAQMQAAVERAQSEATEAIANLPAYVDRVLASMQTPKGGIHETKADRNAATVATFTGGDRQPAGQPIDCGSAERVGQ